eukprot:c12094_g1_i3 orf=371-646(-)
MDPLNLEERRVWPCVLYQYQIIQKDGSSMSMYTNLVCFQWSTHKKFRFHSYNKGSDDPPQVIHDIVVVNLHPSQRRIINYIRFLLMCLSLM